MTPTFVAFDTETTGLDPIEDEICEIAGFKFKIEDGKLVYISQYETLVQISGSMPEKASSINHIYDDMLEGAPKPQDAIARFIRWVGPSPIMLAHHAACDVSFIGQAIKHHQLMVPRNPTFCTKRIACRLVSGRHRLVDLEEVLLKGDKEWEQYKGSGERHRALYDCLTLANVFSTMIKRFASSSSLSDVNNCLKILSHLDGAKRAFDMPMDSHQLQQEMEEMKRMGVR